MNGARIRGINSEGEGKWGRWTGAKWFIGDLFYSED